VGKRETAVEIASTLNISLLRLLGAVPIAAAISSCAGGASNPPLVSLLPPGASDESHHKSSKYIKHVIVMIQENRSFDDFFATFPGADGTTEGKTPSGKIPLKEVNLVESCDFGHSYEGYRGDYDDGKMDGWVNEGAGKCKGKAGKAPYQYVNPAQIAPYWDIGKQYVLADEMFQTQGSGSFTGHQDLIRGGTMIDQGQTQSLVDNPTAFPWGCDAPGGTTTPLLVWKSGMLSRISDGPYPCTNKFPSSGEYYGTMRDLLDAKKISWKYYSPPVKNGVGEYWNAYDAIAAVRYSSEWGTNVTTSSPFEKGIFTDISSGNLASVSWLIPDDGNSDHPGSASDRGPSWVASVVNAVGQSKYWKSTAIVIIWDDWGGFYDHVPPPSFDHWGGLGFRVPMMLVSAYARKGSGSEGGYISPTQYEFGSVLKFIENNWNLGSLGTTDTRATSIDDCFDFSQPARTFTEIPSSYSRSFFRHLRETYQPIDSE
jgi:phospholipase C